MSRPTKHDAARAQSGWRLASLLCLLPAWLAAGGSAQAQAVDAQALQPRALAAGCSQCHGTDGRAVEGTPFERLAGRPADELLARLMAYRTGQRPATVMQQIAKGYTPEQLESLARFFAAQK